MQSGLVFLTSRDFSRTADNVFVYAEGLFCVDGIVNKWPSFFPCGLSFVFSVCLQLLAMVSMMVHRTKCKRIRKWVFRCETMCLAGSWSETFDLKVLNAI